ncbi:hypothetical protein [Paraburkholderia fungorum]|uniref:hypothetical protein n=1 Tax=Paraburkholderia fungorum TaxID=134537 RepID=UPI00402BDADA
MSRLKIGVTSILGLAAALAARPVTADVEGMINAARLSPAQKFVVQTMDDFAALQGARPGDYVTVVVGASASAKCARWLLYTKRPDRRFRHRRTRPRRGTRDRGAASGSERELPLSYAPTQGLDSIQSFGNVCSPTRIP